MEAKQPGNIYTIDTKMFSFDRYMSAFIVKGKEVALVDTGQPSRLDIVREAIKAYGFNVADITSIFITHSHPDHSGNVGGLLREAPRAVAYIHPLGVAQLIDPSLEADMRKKVLPAYMHPQIGEMVPVAPERIRTVKDGDVFDLGDGERLRVIYAPGHQPDGIVLYEEKNRGLFINDLVGNCFLDADSHYILNPPGSDHRDSLKSLQKMKRLALDYLYLGHFGISDEPARIIQRSIEKTRQLLDLGRRYMKAGQPEKIAPEVYAILLEDLEKLRAARGEEVYRYATGAHISRQAEQFAEFCRQNLA